MLKILHARLQQYLKPGLEDFEHYFTSMWDECNCAVLWAFFVLSYSYSIPGALAKIPLKHQLWHLCTLACNGAAVWKKSSNPQSHTPGKFLFNLQASAWNPFLISCKVFIQPSLCFHNTWNLYLLMTNMIFPCYLHYLLKRRDLLSAA